MLFFARSITEIGCGGRVRSDSMKQLIAKQLGSAFESLERQPLMDLKTGRIQSKKVKAKKEKTPEQMALSEAKTMQNKLLSKHMVPEWFKPQFFAPCKCNMLDVNCLPGSRR